MIKKIKKYIKNKGLVKTFFYCFYSLIYCIFAKIICKLVLNNLKIKNNYIIFDSFPDFSDNAKVYYEYLIQNNDKSYKFIWLVNDKSHFQNNKNTIYLNKSCNLYKGPNIRCLYYASVANIIFYTHTESILKNIKQKNNQLIINLWHGCGYKKKESTVQGNFIDSNYFDYVLVPGKIFIETKLEFFGCKKEQILPIGYPRYDMLLTKSEEAENFINEIGKNKKIIIWMPTFRKSQGNNFPEESINKSYDLPLLNSDEELIELNRICKNNDILLIIKRHPIQIEYSCESLNLSNIVFISNNDLKQKNVDLYSILRYTDALITDYSSIAIDYMLLDKPIGFALSDFNEYKDTRGFVFDNPLDYMPGHHMYGKDELFNFVEDIINNNDIYKDKRKIVFNDFHNSCDNYCKRINEEIIRIQNKKGMN